MSNIKKDLELAHAIIEDREKFTEYYSQFYRMWPFTTLNMKEYLSLFDLTDKVCITIQGSSDHVFEISLQNPKKIVGIDSNPLTQYPFYLKQAAFQVLETPEEYLKFFRWKDYPKFCKYNTQVFDRDIYKEIQKYLDEDAKIFWNELFACYDPKMIRSKLFNEPDEINNNALIQSLNYLSSENYQYIRENCTKIPFEFRNIDIRNLYENLDENFDFLTLSNVILYASYMFPKDQLNNFKKIVEKLGKKLNSNGNIMVGYLYDIEDEQEDYKDVYKKSVRDSIFLESQYTYQYVTKIHDFKTNRKTENHDACLIYTKK